MARLSTTAATGSSSSGDWTALQKVAVRVVAVAADRAVTVRRCGTAAGSRIAGEAASTAAAAATGAGWLAGGV